MQSKSNITKEDIFRDSPVPTALRKMIIPAIASQLIVLIYNMADTFFVGQTNNPYMVAGTSLILPVFNITLCFAGLAGIGGGSLISRLLGQSQRDEARRVSAFSLYIAILISVIFSLSIAFFMHPILKLLGAGIATCISNCVAMLFFIVVLLRLGKGSVITFSLKDGLPGKKASRRLSLRFYLISSMSLSKSSCYRSTIWGWQPSES